MSINIMLMKKLADFSKKNAIEYITAIGKKFLVSLSSAYKVLFE